MNAGSGVVPIESDLGEHGIDGANALIDSRDEDFGSAMGDLFAVGASPEEAIDEAAHLAGIRGPGVSTEAGATFALELLTVALVVGADRGGVAPGVVTEGGVGHRKFPSR